MTEKEKEPGNEERRWYAVRVHRPFDLERALGHEEECEGWLPKVTVYGMDMKPRTVKPLIPGVMFIHATGERMALLERDSHPSRALLPSFTVYRDASRQGYQPVTESEMRLMRVLTDTNFEGCEIYQKENFRAGLAVEITAGPFEGYRGRIRVIRKDRRVIVRLSGVCAIALPSIPQNILKPLGKDVELI